MRPISTASSASILSVTNSHNIQGCPVPNLSISSRALVFSLRKGEGRGIPVRVRQREVPPGDMQAASARCRRALEHQVRRARGGLPDLDFGQEYFLLVLGFLDAQRREYRLFRS